MAKLKNKNKFFIVSVIAAIVAGGYCFVSDFANNLEKVDWKEIASNEQFEESAKIISHFGIIGKTADIIPDDIDTAHKLENVDDIGVVMRVVDGDTYVLLINNTETKVRLIGIDTPESVAPESYRKDNTAEGKEISEIVKDKIREDDILYIEYDVQKTDNYGRTLAYLYFPDGIMVQEWLLENGYANIATYPPNVKYTDRFKETAQAASENKAGLWNGFFESEEVKYD